jgi:chlorite dismutase
VYRSFKIDYYYLIPEDEREAMINEFKTFINDKASAREQQAGDYALYNITGQKADILLWIVNECFEFIDHSFTFILRH